MLKSLHEARATTAITVPQMLRALAGETAAGAPAPSTLRFLAVGGAPVAPALLEQARGSGLAVYEGYGLSECASVLTLNRPGADRPGSVGRPLPHVRLSIAGDGEILAEGALLLGYCPAGADVNHPWPTGDIGRLDEGGYLHIEGRKKDFFVTSYGRNVSPEWIESALTAEPEIAQAWVSGEARPWIAAVVTPRNGTPDHVVNAAIGRVNAALPDYARVERWIRSHEPFSARGGELTGNGRLRRHALGKRYGPEIESLYQERTHELLR
jgi:long-subunit acyl-CoA synthetase (AMP-forming)